MIELELSEWGRWVRQDYHGLAAQSHWLMLMRDNAHMMRGAPANMTDERAGQIDRAVCQLARHSVLLFNLFWRRYVCEHNLRQLSAYLHTLKRNGLYHDATSPHAANALLNNATGFITGVLNDL